VAVRERAGALFVDGDAFFNTRRVQIAMMAAHYSIPTAFAVREYVDAGGLMSYGTHLLDMFRQVDVYSGRILRVPSLQICQCCNRPGWSWSSMRRLRECSGPHRRQPCSASPTR
jgi:hypothetical protein